MTAMETFTSPGGARIGIVGPPALLTLERMNALGGRFDNEPRLATVSLVAGSAEEIIRAATPAGALICIRLDHQELIGSYHDLGFESWVSEATNRGLVHEWSVTAAPDIAGAEATAISAADERERQHASAAHFQRCRSLTSKRLSIAIDARWLGEHETGAQVLTTAAVGALARDERVGEIHLRGVDALPAYAEHLLESAQVSLGGNGPADVCWFPNQIDFRSNFGQARSWGDRVITTYLDLIAFDIPRYHASPEAWDSYRTLQRTTALASDGITTISPDVARRLQQEVPLLDPQRVRAIPLGLDHIEQGDVPDQAPAEIADLVRATQSRPFILVLGNDFLHKNRDFAIRVWQELLRSDVMCDLVLAGLHVGGSSSRDREAEAMATHVDLRGEVHTVGHVASQARSWLLAHAAAVLYPSSAEGFGFVPYEAAAMDTPASFTSFGPLAELTGVVDAPRSWTVSAYVQDLRRLLLDEQFARTRVTTLKDAIENRAWPDFADDLVTFMFEITRMPISPAGAVLAELSQDATELNALLASRTWRMTAPLRRAGKAFRGRGRG